MSDTRYLDWPFFDERHRDLARSLDAWATRHVTDAHGRDVDDASPVHRSAIAMVDEKSAIHPT